MNYTVDVNIKLKLAEGTNLEYAESLKDHLQSQINKMLETWDAENKIVDAKVNSDNDNDNWFSPNDSNYDWE